MEILLLILKGTMLFVAVIMTFFILLQEGKGGGLAALGGTTGAQIEGVTNPIRRATAYLAIIFLTLTVLIGFLSKGGNSLVKGGLGEDKPALGLQKGLDEKEGLVIPDGEHLAPDAPGAAKTTEAKTETAKSGEVKTGESKSGEVKTGETKSGDVKTDETKAGEAKSEERKTDAKTAEEKTAEAPAKTEEANSASAKSEDGKTAPVKEEATKTEATK